MNARTCSHCKNLIYDDEALLCHFCGASLSRASSGALGKIRGGGGKWVWIVIALLAALSFVWFNL